MLLFIFANLGLNAFGQGESSKGITFIPAESQQYGFDAFNVPDWQKQYHRELFADSSEHYLAYKSVVEGKVDSVDIVLPSGMEFTDLTFVIEDSIYELGFTQRSIDTFTIQLPAFDQDYWLDVRAGDEIWCKLIVLVYPEETIDVVVVPLMSLSIDEDSLSNYLNRIYRQAGLNVSLDIAAHFKSKKFQDSVLSNPSPDNDRFTDQMIDIRKEYFKKFPDLNKKTYYVFLVNGFVDNNIKAYTVRNKAISFVKVKSNNLYRSIARQLGVSVGALHETWFDNGPDVGTTSNLMDKSGELLTYRQWKILRSMSHSFSYYDSYETVRTNNGIIAYYLWEEDKFGNIIIRDGDLMESIDRPFKRNTYSLHLNIDNFLFMYLFELFGYQICLLHIISFLFLAWLSFFIRRRIVRKSARIKKYRLLRFSTRIVVFAAACYGYFLLFLLINEGYYMFEVKSGELHYLEGMNEKAVSKDIDKNVNIRRYQEEKMGSEVLVKRGNRWTLNRKKKVLYFNIYTGKNGKTKTKFHKDSESLTLKTMDYSTVATSQYFVFNYIDSTGNCTSQKAFNHLGVEITNKIRVPDPAKRVLLFVNGYRPTSLGETFEDNFADIQKNGLEFKNSGNLIYSHDRYSYWHWNDINALFEKRLNPSESYYADGHHEVSTSNHRSLVQFTKLSATYPKRCKNPKHHVCRKSEKGWSFLGLSSDVNTVELHNLEPNVEGFNLRFERGKIAGRNMIQTLNELPNKSKNDTIYLVTHSMGHAYSMGVIDQLRGRINFGGLYIIAPENASAGKVNIGEWKEVWQYGSDFEAHRLTAPCLLDGIAPQTKVGGLSPKHRAYIPEKLYKKMGFFNSHFVGGYTWIFDIPEDKPGFIKQR